jgi:NADH-quinone oxidoreductase subunit M
MQFFVYTMAGSVALLVAFLLLFLGTGTFDFAALAAKARAQTLAGEVLAGLPVGRRFGSPESCLTIVFLLVLLGFAVKLPVVPFHTWLPTTYAEAPTPVTMLLTGLMSKMGVYGLLRIVLPIFGAQVAAYGTALLGFAVATIVLSAAAACVQTDLKRMLGYSSINHLGYCLLGVAAVTRTAGLDTPLGQERVAALNGVSLQIFNHGLTAAALFCFVALLERRAGGGRALADFGGLRQRAPVLCGLMGISLFASLGLPGLNGFIGEFLIFKGVFALTPWAAVASTLGLLLTAVFLLKLLATVFYGPLHRAHHQTADLTVRERCLVVPAVLGMFALGLWPQLLLQYCNPSVVELLTTTGP